MHEKSNTRVILFVCTKYIIYTRVRIQYCMFYVQGTLYKKYFIFLTLRYIQSFLAYCSVHIGSSSFLLKLKIIQRGKKLIFEMYFEQKITQTSNHLERVLFFCLCSYKKQYPQFLPILLHLGSLSIRCNGV